jgi:glucuronoarabinoxylan endo-1,4-beta-xylanase
MNMENFTRKYLYKKARIIERMKTMNSSLLLFSLIVAAAYCTKHSTETKANSRPLVTLKADLTSVDPFTFKFTVTASDADNDPLEYSWDFGEGSMKIGDTTETFIYPADMEYTVKVSVTDKITTPVNISLKVGTKVATIEVDTSATYQTMEGFGGFGAKDVYWSGGPFTSPDFVNTLLDDLGLTILRDHIPENFEPTNENGDPFNTDLSKFNINNSTSGVDGKLSDHIEYLQAMHHSGLQKLIVSVWSPPAWMKTNNSINNGTSQNSAPAYNANPGPADNQLRTDMYEEFAEMCVAYIKTIKEKTGINVYALSIQNEPRFSQFYGSCVYNGEALRELLKIVGKRFKDEAISTRLFLPEDIGWLEGVESMIKPVLDDPIAREYADIVAVHGYDLDGITASSPNAQTWQTMYGWGAAFHKPLWMTETSGFANNYEGGMALAKAIFTAVKFGNVSAWVFWTLSTATLDEYSLMSSSGEKSKRYYASKNYYKYIRPGALRISATAPESSGVFPLAFRHKSELTNTLVLINDNKESSKAVRIKWPGITGSFNMYITSADDNCKYSGAVQKSDAVLLPPYSVMTLYNTN